MNYKKLHATFLIMLITCTTVQNTLASDYFSTAGLQSIGNNIFALPGILGQYLQIDKLLSSLAPSLWNSYGAREQQTIIGVITTLVGVIIGGLLYKQSSAAKNEIETKETLIANLTELATDVERLIPEYKRKLSDKEIFAPEELAQLDNIVNASKDKAQTALETLKTINAFDEDATQAYSAAMIQTTQLEEIGLKLKARAVINALNKFTEEVTSFQEKKLAHNISNINFNSLQKKHDELKQNLDEFTQEANIGNITPRYEAVTNAIDKAKEALNDMQLAINMFSGQKEGANVQEAIELKPLTNVAELPALTRQIEALTAQAHELDPAADYRAVAPFQRQVNAFKQHLDAFTQDPKIRDLKNRYDDVAQPIKEAYDALNNLQSAIE